MFIVDSRNYSDLDEDYVNATSNTASEVFGHFDWDSFVELSVLCAFGA